MLACRHIPKIFTWESGSGFPLFRQLVVMDTPDSHECELREGVLVQQWMGTSKIWAPCLFVLLVPSGLAHAQSLMHNYDLIMDCCPPDLTTWLVWQTQFMMSDSGFMVTWWLKVRSCLYQDQVPCQELYSKKYIILCCSAWPCFSMSRVCDVIVPLTLASFPTISTSVH